MFPAIITTITLLLGVWLPQMANSAFENFITQTNKNVLNLSEELKAFETCHVHIAVAHIEGVNSGKFSPRYPEEHGSYDIEPLHYPWVYSVHRFKYMWLLGWMLCDGHQYNITQGQKYGSRATPHTLTCELQVHIAPYPCTHQWAMVLAPLFSGLLPPGYFNLYRHPTITVPVFRPMRFLAFVSRSLNFTSSNSKSILKAADRDTGFGGDVAPLNLQTKLLFLIGSSSKSSNKSSVVVVSTYIVTQPTWTANSFTKTTGKCRKAGIATQYCLDGIEDQLPLQLVEYQSSDSMPTMAWVRDQSAIQYRCRSCPTPSKPLPSNLHLSSWEEDQHTDLVLLQIMTPRNSSLLILSNTQIHMTYYIPSFSIKVKPEHEDYFWTEGSGLHFITCASINEIGAFDGTGYISQYDSASWQFLFSIVIITSGAILIQFSVTIDATTGRRAWWRMPTLSEIYSSVAFGPLVLLEQGVDLVDKFKWISGPWILVGIVLSNAYRGDNITLLIAPLPIQRLQTFEEVMAHNLSVHSANFIGAGAKGYRHEFDNTIESLTTGLAGFDNMLNFVTGETIFDKREGELRRSKNDVATFEEYFNKVVTSPELMEMLVSKGRHGSYRPPNGGSWTQNVYQSEVEAILREGQILYRQNYTNSTHLEKEEWLIQNIHVPQTIEELRAMDTPRYFIDKISECGRDAYVSSYGVIRKFYWQMKSEFLERWSGAQGGPHDPDGIVMGAKAIVMLDREWQFRNWRWEHDTLLRRIRALSESGLAQLWHGWERRVRSWNDTVEFERKYEPPVKKVTMNDNISVVFIVFGICIIFPIAAFLLEVVVIWRRSSCCLGVMINSRELCSPFEPCSNQGLDSTRAENKRGHRGLQKRRLLTRKTNNKSAKPQIDATFVDL